MNGAYALAAYVCVRIDLNLYDEKYDKIYK